MAALTVLDEESQGLAVRAVGSLGGTSNYGHLHRSCPEEGNMIVLDAALMAAITVAMVGFLTWAICTQYRHAGCAHLRIRRRLQVNVTLDQPQSFPGSKVAL